MMHSWSIRDSVIDQNSIADFHFGRHYRVAQDDAPYTNRSRRAYNGRRMNDTRNLEARLSRILQPFHANLAIPNGSQHMRKLSPPLRKTPDRPDNIQTMRIHDAVVKKRHRLPFSALLNDFIYL